MILHRKLDMTRGVRLEIVVSTRRAGISLTVYHFLVDLNYLFAYVRKSSSRIDVTVDDCDNFGGSIVEAEGSEIAREKRRRHFCWQRGAAQAKKYLLGESSLE